MHIYMIVSLCPAKIFLPSSRTPGTARSLPGVYSITKCCSPGMHRE